MLRLVCSILFLCPVLAACSTGAGLLNRNKPPTAQTQQADPARLGGDIAVLEEVRDQLRAGSFYYRASAPSLGEENGVLFRALAERRDVLAADTQAVLGEVTGKADAYLAEEDPAMTAGVPGGAEAINAALESEIDFIELLQTHLADDSLSIETKTFFQQILPGLRTEQRTLTILAEKAESQETEEGDGGEVDEEVEGEPGDEPGT